MLCSFPNKKILLCVKNWKFSCHENLLISVQISSYKMLGRRFLVLWTEVKSFDTSAQVFWKSFDILESLQLHCRDNCSRHPHHGNLSKWFSNFMIVTNFMIMTRIPGFFQVLRMATGVPSNMSALPWEWWPWWSLIMVITDHGDHWSWWSLIMVSKWFQWIPWIPELSQNTVFITLP